MDLSEVFVIIHDIFQGIGIGLDMFFYGYVRSPSQRWMCVFSLVHAPAIILKIRPKVQPIIKVIRDIKLRKDIAEHPYLGMFIYPGILFQRSQGAYPKVISSGILDNISRFIIGWAERPGRQRDVHHIVASVLYLIG